MCMNINDFLKLDFKETSKVLRSTFDEKRPDDFPENFIEKLGKHIDGITQINNNELRIYEDSAPIGSVYYKTEYRWSKVDVEFSIIIKCTQKIWAVFVLKNNSSNLILDKIRIRPRNLFKLLENSLDKTRVLSNRAIKIDYTVNLTKNDNITVYDYITNIFPIVIQEIDSNVTTITNILKGSYFYEKFNFYKTRFSDFPDISNINNSGNIISSLIHTVKDIDLATEYAVICFMVGLGSIPEPAIKGVDNIFKYFFYNYGDNAVGPLNNIPQHILDSIKHIKDVFADFLDLDGKFVNEVNDIKLQIDDNIKKFNKRVQARFNKEIYRSVLDSISFYNYLFYPPCPNYQL